MIAGLADAARTSASTTRTSTSSATRPGAEREGVALDDLLGWADVVVVVTAHRAIDWDRVYERADLVVDTVDSSRGRATRPRQVLRLGAGWSAHASR